MFSASMERRWLRTRLVCGSLNLTLFTLLTIAIISDEIPSKKPIQIEDQIVKDENGRRRFHGAFTGGFSAGYWNTVGSKEGSTS